MFVAFLLLLIVAIVFITAGTAAWFSISDNTRLYSINMDVTAGAALRFGRLRGLLFGKPCFLIEKGVINQREMSRNRFTLDELTEELRRQSVTDPATVEYAVLETDGSLNVLLFPAHQPVTAGDLGLAEESRGYPRILISDGRVIEDNLRKSGKTLAWLKEECRARGAASISDVFVLSLDDSGGIYFAGKETT